MNLYSNKNQTRKRTDFRTRM